MFGLTRTVRCDGCGHAVRVGEARKVETWYDRKSTDTRWYGRSCNVLGYDRKVYIGQTSVWYSMVESPPEDRHSYKYYRADFDRFGKMYYRDVTDEIVPPPAPEPKPKRSHKKKES